MSFEFFHFLRFVLFCFISFFVLYHLGHPHLGFTCEFFPRYRYFLVFLSSFPVFSLDFVSLFILFIVIRYTSQSQKPQKKLLTLGRPLPGKLWICGLA